MKMYPVFRFAGILMVLAWIIFATVGELIARYYKSLLFNTKIFGAAVWFRLGVTPV